MATPARPQIKKRSNTEWSVLRDGAQIAVILMQGPQFFEVLHGTEIDPKFDVAPTLMQAALFALGL